MFQIKDQCACQDAVRMSGTAPQSAADIHFLSGKLDDRHLDWVCRSAACAHAARDKQHESRKLKGMVLKHV